MYELFSYSLTRALSEPSPRTSHSTRKKVRKKSLLWLQKGRFSTIREWRIASAGCPSVWREGGARSRTERCTTPNLDRNHSGLHYFTSNSVGFQKSKYNIRLGMVNIPKLIWIQRYNWPKLQLTHSTHDPTSLVSGDFAQTYDYE